MAYPTYGGFSLQTDDYIVADIEYRTAPTREISLESISRKPGKKFLSTEFGERKIKMSGFILGTSATVLQTNIDSFHENVTSKTTGVLAFDATRSISATVSSVTITDPQYSQTIVPFEIEFIAADPFYEGAEQTAVTTVASGNSSKAITTTISGSVFAEPTFTFTSNGSSGYTTTSGIKVEYETTGEYVTWSGGNNTLAYGSSVQFDYKNLKILEDTTEIEAEGSYSRWEPGSTTITTTFSGTTQGGTLALVYKPRYL